jgi:hypothetical protein
MRFSRPVVGDGTAGVTLGFGRDGVSLAGVAVAR